MTGCAVGRYRPTPPWCTSWCPFAGKGEQAGRGPGTPAGLVAGSVPAGPDREEGQRPRRPAVRGARSSSSQSPRLGRPITEYTPLALEVHRAIDVPSHGEPLPLLPPYVPRDHDARLAHVVAEAAGGASRMVVLVGGSSTGKTRACWEAIQALPSRWWLWHPIDPSRPRAAAR